MSSEAALVDVDSLRYSCTSGFTLVLPNVVMGAGDLCSRIGNFSLSRELCPLPFDPQRRLSISDLYLTRKVSLTLLIYPRLTDLCLAPPFSDTSNLLQIFTSKPHFIN
jgi:hypothetical protein